MEGRCARGPVNQPLDVAGKRDAPRDRRFGERRGRRARGQSQPGDAWEDEVLIERGDRRVGMVHRSPVVMMLGFLEDSVSLGVPVHHELDVPVVVLDFVDVLRRHQRDDSDGGGENGAEEPVEQHGRQC